VQIPFPFCGWRAHGGANRFGPDLRFNDRERSLGSSAFPRNLLPFLLGIAEVVEASLTGAKQRARNETSRSSRGGPRRARARRTRAAVACPARPVAGRPPAPDLPARSRAFVALRSRDRHPPSVPSTLLGPNLASSRAPASEYGIVPLDYPAAIPDCRHAPSRRRDNRDYPWPALPRTPLSATVQNRSASRSSRRLRHPRAHGCRHTRTELASAQLNTGWRSSAKKKKKKNARCSEIEEGTSAYSYWRTPPWKSASSSRIRAGDEHPSSRSYFLIVYAKPRHPRTQRDHEGGGGRDQPQRLLPSPPEVRDRVRRGRRPRPSEDFGALVP